MFNFLLGVADSKAITKEDLLEFQNSVYGQMKDVQDIARNVQSDQISFLNTNITVFLTVAAIILAIVGLFASVVLSQIKKANEEAATKMTTAQRLMDNASTMMAAAQQLEEQANAKITELENLLNSKQLNDKISKLEKSAATTSKLEKQVQATVNLQHAQTLIEDAKRIYDAYFHDLNDDVRTETRAATFKYHQLKHQMSQLSFEVHAIGGYDGIVNDTQVLEETRGVLKKALDLNQHANTLYDQVQERRKDLGD